MRFFRTFGTALALGAAVLALPAEAARPKYTRGSYDGYSDRVSVRFTAGRSLVTGFRFLYLTRAGACSNGNRFQGDWRVYRGGTDTELPLAAIPIRRGSFSVVVQARPEYNVTGRLTVTGKLKGKVATGTLRETATFTTGARCDSGRLKWRARV